MTRRLPLVAAGAFVLAVASFVLAAMSASDNMSSSAQAVNDVAGWCLAVFLAVAVAAAVATLVGRRSR